ncbi:unnamed protein product [Anisakis simplex]|uniref:TMhelix containing protein n=1 Tax=Anisakis simplex TaxID=6269 RepID=A0A0M3K3D7_ANISI|nr:unnamed protein product [Anisakis simplex]
MWYEQLYSGAITIFFVWGACLMSYPFNRLDVHRAYRRNYGNLERLICHFTTFNNNFRIQLSQRDHRLTGNQYVISGLNAIPDA